MAKKCTKPKGVTEPVGFATSTQTGVYSVYFLFNAANTRSVMA
jgi:hypothetical protein